MQLKYSNYVAFSHIRGKVVNNSGLNLCYKNFCRHRYFAVDEGAGAATHIAGNDDEKFTYR